MNKLYTHGCSHTAWIWPTWANILAYSLRQNGIVDQHVQLARPGAGCGYVAHTAVLLGKTGADDIHAVLWPSLDRVDEYGFEQDGPGKWNQWRLSGTPFNSEYWNNTDIQRHWAPNNCVLINRANQLLYTAQQPNSWVAHTATHSLCDAENTWDNSWTNPPQAGEFNQNGPSDRANFLQTKRHKLNPYAPHWLIGILELEGHLGPHVHTQWLLDSHNPMHHELQRAWPTALRTISDLLTGNRSPLKQYINAVNSAVLVQLAQHIESLQWIHSVVEHNTNLSDSPQYTEFLQDLWSELNSHSEDNTDKPILTASEHCKPCIQDTVLSVAWPHCFDYPAEHSQWMWNQADVHVLYAQHYAQLQNSLTHSSRS